MIKLSSPYTTLFRMGVPAVLVIVSVIFVIQVYSMADIYMAGIAALFLLIQLIILFFFQPTTKLQIVFFDEAKKQFKMIKGNDPPVIWYLGELDNIKYKNSKIFCCLIFKENQKVWFMLPSDKTENEKVKKLLEDLRQKHLYQYQS